MAEFFSELLKHAAITAIRQSSQPQLPVAAGPSVSARKERLGWIKFTVSRSTVAIAEPPNFPAWSEVEPEFGAFVQEIVALDAVRGAEALADTLVSDWKNRADACLNHRCISVQVEAATRFIGNDFIVITFWRGAIQDVVPAHHVPPQSSDSAEPGAAPAALSANESMYCRQVPSAPPAAIVSF
jgi:hypothetical protein